MTEPSALHFEVKKDGFNQLQSGSYKLTVTLNPADMDDNAQSLLLDFVKAPMGTRYMLAFAGIEEDGAGDAPETPASLPEKKERQPFHTLRRSAQAAMACKDRDFQWWITDEKTNPTEETAIYALCAMLNIKSRAELDGGLPLSREWNALYARFQQETGRVPEVR